MEKHSYNVHVAWSRDRRGVVCSPELLTDQGANCIEVATPPEFPKGIPGLWSPEHLFTAAVASCFMTTFLAIAEASQLPFVGFDCVAEGVLEEVDGKPELTGVILRPAVAIPDERHRERTLRIVQKTENACLVSHAVRCKIATVPTITVE